MAKRTTTTKVKSDRKITVRHNPAVVTGLYANHVSVSASNIDTKLSFGVVRGAKEDEIDVEILSEVYLTHKVADSLGKLIIETLEQQEKKG